MFKKRGAVHRRAATVALTAAFAITSGCVASYDVVAVRSENGTPPVESDRPVTPPAPVGAASIALSPCPQIADTFIPADDDVTAAEIEGWDCGWFNVPVDPLNPGSEAIQIAVTRRVGANSGGRALFFNPGGPGGSGVDTVWSLWDLLPTAVLDSYDIVGWDPRGVGASLPRLACPPDTRWGDDDLFEICQSEWGPLPGHMSTANTVADLEALRIAFGQPELNYVGYSYGTYIGALYVRDHSNTVGRFVLDGSVSPDSGTDDSPQSYGDAYYALDGADDVFDRFTEMCQVTSYCAVADPIDAVDQVAFDADELFISDYPANPELTSDEVWETADWAAANPDLWGIFSNALARAESGDGTALAALAVFSENDDESDGVYVEAEDNQQLVSATIYCADFAQVKDRSRWCDAAADNQLAVGEITAVDTALPIVVIGNEFDPATPFEHARDMRTRLNDAVLLEWNGVGHTVFPGQSDCIDNAVEGYLVAGTVPQDFTICPFLDDVADSNMGAIADYWFELSPEWLTHLVRGQLDQDGLANSECLAAEIVDGFDDDVAVDIFLDIDSTITATALDVAHGACD